MAYYPFSPEIGARYVLTSPDGLSQAVMNDTFDPNYVGVLSEVTGLDGADIRESAADQVEADGGSHGNFYFSRRPITMTGLVYNNASNYQRQARLDKLTRASLALRGDSSLTWRPAVRRENLIFTNPSIEGTDISAYGALACSNSRAATGGTYGPALLRSTATAAQSFGPYVASTIPNRPAATPGKTYTAGVNFITIPAGRTAHVSIEFYDNGGARQGNGISAPFTSSTGFQTVTATAPPGTTNAAITAYTNNGAVGEILEVDGFFFTEGAYTGGYVDGDTAGYVWQGAQYASISGDYVEMFVPVRRQQPLRVTGGFNKTFLLALVSQYATIFSSFVRSTASTALAANASVDNRGNWPSYPIVRITGGALANPTFTINGVTFTTAGQGLTIAAGETMEVDMLNHTATFIAGARNGQSANRYINFASTVWPFVPAGGASYNATLGGTGSGSAVVLWRDTWA